MISIDTIGRIPKVELHDHLDGGLRPQTIIELAGKYGTDIPARDPEALAAWFERGCMLKSLPLYLETFAVTTAVMQTQEALERIAYEAVLDWKKQNIVYGEIRFAPVLHTEKGLTYDEIVQAVLKGLEQGKKDTGVHYGLIICAMRNRSPQTSLEMAALAVKYLGRGVVGFDIAGGEKGNPPEVHLEAFRLAHKGGARVTIHAGEACGCDSIRQAVMTCEADRLGHGTSLAQDLVCRGPEILETGELARYVKDRRITLEMCLSSNVGTGAVASFAEHPFNLFLQNGFNVCLCTDNRLMSNTTLSKEMGIAASTWNLGLDDMERISVNAMESAFIGEDGKRELLENPIRKTFAEIRAESMDRGGANALD